MPIYAVTILYQLNHLDVPISSDNAAAGVTGVPPVIDTGVIIVDKSNYTQLHAVVLWISNRFSGWARECLRSADSSVS